MQHFPLTLKINFISFCLQGFVPVLAVLCGVLQPMLVKDYFLHVDRGCSLVLVSSCGICNRIWFKSYLVYRW